MRPPPPDAAGHVHIIPLLPPARRTLACTHAHAHTSPPLGALHRCLLLLTSPFRSVLHPSFFLPPTLCPPPPPAPLVRRVLALLRATLRDDDRDRDKDGSAGPRAGRVGRAAERRRARSRDNDEQKERLAYRKIHPLTAAIAAHSALLDGSFPPCSRSVCHPRLRRPPPGSVFVDRRLKRRTRVHVTRDAEDERTGRGCEYVGRGSFEVRAVVLRTASNFSDRPYIP